MIGLGGGSLVKYCLAALPDTAVTVVEIKPAVIALREAFGIPPDGPRLRVVCVAMAPNTCAIRMRYPTC